MHKELLLLGLLQSGHNTGYELHRIVAARGDLYTDLKRGNIYYLLERLAERGLLTVTAEPGARGPRRERLIYTLTDRGRARFYDLLRDVVRTFELAHTGVEVGVAYLPYLAPDEAIALLEERRQAVLARRALSEREGHGIDHLYVELAQDHLRTLMDAELAWIERTIRRLHEHQRSDAPRPASSHGAC